TNRHRAPRGPAPARARHLATPSKARHRASLNPTLTSQPTPTPATATDRPGGACRGGRSWPRVRAGSWPWPGRRRWPPDQHDGTAEVGAPLVIAAVDGGHSSYWHRRADGSDALRMLLEEFVPLAEQGRSGLPKALLGWSMGGYGALLAAERTAERTAAPTAG